MFYAHLKFYIGAQQTLPKPLHALFSAKLFFSMNRRTDFDASFKDLFQKL